jgi:hypothetical protein
MLTLVVFVGTDCSDLDVIANAQASSVSFSPPPYNATNCPNPTPTPSGSSSGLSSVQIVGISIASAAVLLGFSILVYRRYARRRQAAYEALN